jgi:hypothetical protein
MVHQKDLKENYFLFGNKGSVWSNTAHIFKGSEGNLCGTPALSTNWVRIEGVKVAGCQECIDIYNNKLKELNK